MAKANTITKEKDAKPKKTSKKEVSPKVKKPSTRDYFTLDTQDAIIEYNNTEDPIQKNIIFNKRIKFAFFKLAEYLINCEYIKYSKLNNDFNDLQNDIVVYMLSKIQNYNIDKGRAFSYFNYISLNELRRISREKYEHTISHLNYETVDFDDESLQEYEQTDNVDNLIKFFKLFTTYVYDNLEVLYDKQKDRQIVDAIMQLFEHRNNIENFNKKALYIMIRDMANESNTPQITIIVKQIKSLFTILYQEFLDYGYIKYKAQPLYPIKVIPQTLFELDYSEN